MCAKRTWEAALAKKYDSIPPEKVAEVCADKWHNFEVEMELDSLVATVYKPQVAQPKQQQQQQQLASMQIDHDLPTVQEAEERSTSRKGANSPLNLYICSSACIHSLYCQWWCVSLMLINWHFYFVPVVPPL